MAGQEKQFENKVRAYLNSIGAYVYKTMGGLFTKSGIADLLVCYKGYNIIGNRLWRIVSFLLLPY